MQSYAVLTLVETKRGVAARGYGPYLKPSSAAALVAGLRATVGDAPGFRAWAVELERAPKVGDRP